MKEYTARVKAEFIKNANPEYARFQKAYLRNQFEFLGLKSPLKKEVSRQFLTKSQIPVKGDLLDSVKTFWNMPEREFQHFGMELCSKYYKQMEVTDADIFEYMITHKSWWDTVDYIAANLVGTYFKTFPGRINGQVEDWMNSSNIWLQRTCLIFQLKYKNEVDFELMTDCINRLLGSKEFFINKAIGWALRQYSKFSPDDVRGFVAKTDLHPVSKREAVKYI